MDKKIEFIFIMGKHSFTHVLFGDVLKDDRVIVFDPLKPISSEVLKKVRTLHLSLKMNIFFDLPFKTIWSKSFKNINWKGDVRYYIVFFNTQMNTVNYRILKKLKRKYDIKFVLHFIDPYQSNNSFYARRHIKHIDFDHIITFDEEDAKRYNFQISSNIYSMLPHEKKNSCDIDIYFVGWNKGRLNRLLECHELFRNNGIKDSLRIAGVSEKDMQFKDEIIYNHSNNYPELVAEIQSCNCILEFIQPKQSGATARYYEAVCYNKKLLTNNKNVVNLPFYNPKYIHVFEEPEDIDCDWVKERIPVDYGYDGRFSPIHLLDKIVELDKGKEREQSVEE